MPRSLALLLPVMASSLVGCGPEPPKPEPPVAGEAWDHSPRPYMEPEGTGRAAPTPDDGKKVIESFQVELEEVEKLEEGVVEVGSYNPKDEESLVSRSSNRMSLALKIRLTNHYEHLKFLVGPRRFRLETPTGRKIEPSLSARKEPALTEGYLSGGTSTSGWLVFKVPLGQKSLTLVSDLRRPPVELPVPLPESTD